MSLAVETHPFDFSELSFANQPNRPLSPAPTRVIIALGKNWNQNLQPEAHNPRELLSAESYMTALAAAKLARTDARIYNTRYGQHGVNILVINSTGYTRNGFPTESSAMEYVQKEQFPDFGKTQGIYVKNEENSIDTPGNMEEAVRILKEMNVDGYTFTDINLVTVGFHMRRALAFAKRYGLHVHNHSKSEDVVQRDFTEDNFFTADYHEHDWMRRQEMLESGLTAVLAVDPFKGKVFPRILTRNIIRK